jgi:putative DNA primase/helicase
LIMSETLEAALRYAAHGWAVFPAPPNEKKSYKSMKYSGGTRWGATRDLDEVRRDFTCWPHARIGLPTGVDSGIVVVEIDTIEGHGVDGRAALRALEQAHAPLPDTLQAESPSGSIHRYFRHPGAGVKVVCSASKLGAGVDVKGDGGMVIAPPSINPDGRAYRWLNDLSIADMPAWLVELTREKPPTISQRAAVTVSTSMPTDRRLRGLARAVLHARDGERNAVLHWASCRVGELIADGNADVDLAFDILAEAARVVGLEPSEIGPTIASGIRKGCAA